MTSADELDAGDLRRLERLALLGRLSGGMIHDFRNMLTGIQSMLQYALNRSAPESEVHGVLVQTLIHVHQTNELIQTTLEFFSSKQRDAEQHTDVALVVRHTCNLIRHLLPARVRLDVAVEPGLPPLRGQAPLYQEVLLNLCLNAVDAMRDKGELLTIQVRRAGPVVIAGQEDLPGAPAREGEWLELAVGDDGQGIEVARQQQLFRAFHTGRQTGLGLGLWMVRETVARLGGRIQVASEPGVGSCFRVLFPAAKGDVIASGAAVPAELRIAPGPAGAPKATRDATILVVDDDPLIMVGMVQWLKSAGYRLLTAGNGDQAWELFLQEESRIDAVIQDFLIPGKRGELLLRDFLAHRPGLPVIVISAFPEARDFAWIQEHGACAVLPKPFEMPQLLQVLADNLQARGQTQPAGRQ